MLATEATSTSWKKKQWDSCSYQVVSRNFNTNFRGKNNYVKKIGTGM